MCHDLLSFTREKEKVEIETENSKEMGIIIFESVFSPFTGSEDMMVVYFKNEWRVIIIRCTGLIGRTYGHRDLL